MENIRNNETNCKVNLMKFCGHKNHYQSGYNEDKSGGQRDEICAVEIRLFPLFGLVNEQVIAAYKEKAEQVTQQNSVDMRQSAQIAADQQKQK